MPWYPPTHVFGVLTQEMTHALVPHVRGRVVWDLGAGFLLHANDLVTRYGATSVVAVDKEEMPEPTSPKITRVRSRFHDLTLPKEGIEVAFLAFPQNIPLPGLVEVLRRSQRVIYFGSNTDGTACGDKNLFGHLREREVLSHVPHPRNSLIVYGEEHPGWRRALVPEEWAALHPEKMWSFEEACSALSSLPAP